MFGRPDCRSDTHRNGKQSVRRSKREIADGRPKAFAAFSYRLQIAVGHNNQKFFSAYPSDVIVAARGFAEAFCGFPKDDIADEVAIGIVDPLEMVEVGDENRKRLMASFSPR